MNPFKIKVLKDFTIVDCEVYLNRYPYGEHSVEVKKTKKELMRGLAEIMGWLCNATNNKRVAR